MKKRVVITGMGAITSLGFDINTFWQSIKTGKSGISLIERIDVSDLPTKVAAEIKDFNPIDFIEKKEVKRLDRFSQYAMAAAQMAVESSQLDAKILQSGRTGIILGSGIGGLETLENQYNTLLEKGTNRVSPFLIPMMLSNMAAGTLAIKFGIKGFVECVVSACATSTNAIGDAFKIIQRDAADVMLTGGAEAAITRLAMAGFCASKAMTTNENIDTACRPFDLERNGFVMGEGAGVLVVEELNHALNRGADIIAEIVGYGCTNDAYHITAVDPKGDSAAACMNLALEDAGLTTADIQYINAHGTSTELNDRMETTAIKTAFGAHADKIAVSSTKSMTGHLLGAAGAIEAIITSMALKEGFLPPTIHYKNSDPACDLDYVPNQGRQNKIIYALSNSFGFGGHNATLALKAYK